MSRVCVPGGAGYVGSMLVPALLAQGHDVSVLDTYQYGRESLAPLRGAQGLREITGDVRDRETVKAALAGCDAVIHLACVSNDPSFELDPDLARTINYDCFPMFVEEAKRAGVSRFVYVSSSSVYGVSEADRVGEDHPLLPLTDYSKYKALCEEIVRAERAPGFEVLVLRPATVCGFSTRMRFDLSVNILTNHAVNRRAITVFGGAQTRPNIHIADVVELYTSVLREPAEKIDGKIYNAGFQNHAIADLARIVQSVVEREFPELAPIAIRTEPTDDLRSYRVDSALIERELGYRPRRTIEDAVRDLCAAFRAGCFTDSMDDARYFNVKQMKALALA